MRTLIISDLHLGTRRGHDVLRHPEPLARLLEALGAVDRLVLLGDTVELMLGRPQQAMAVAEPVLRAIADALPPGAGIVLVPGNHDLPLVRRWVRERARALTLDTSVPHEASPALQRMAAWVGAERLEVRYPGVWLREDVWALHGHYLDRHLLPQSAVGVSGRLFGRSLRGPATIADYEARRRQRSLSGGYRWLPRPLAAALSDGLDLMRAATMMRLRRRLLNPRLAPLTSSLLALQMRMASLPALARVVGRLEVDAEWIVFGHVHRLGPLPDDDPEAWRAPGGARLVNCGSWLYEPRLVHRAVPPHPYWPGGGVILDGTGDPRAMCLLDGLGHAGLR